MSVLRLLLRNDMYEINEVPKDLHKILRIPEVIEMPTNCHAITLGRTNSNPNVNYHISCLYDCRLISRIHATIVRDKPEGTYHIWDESLNGTFLNFQRVLDGTKLMNGDVICFGHPTGSSILRGEIVVPYRWDLKYEVVSRFLVCCSALDVWILLIV